MDGSRRVGVHERWVTDDQVLNTHRYPTKLLRHTAGGLARKWMGTCYLRGRRGSCGLFPYARGTALWRAYGSGSRVLVRRVEVRVRCVLGGLWFGDPGSTLVRSCWAR